MLMAGIMLITKSKVWFWSLILIVSWLIIQKLHSKWWMRCDIILLSYFSVVVCLRWLVVLSYSVIYYPVTLGPCFHYWCSVYGICKWSDTLWPVGHIRFFADYTMSLSSLCRPIWRHWTTKMLVRYMLQSVCLRLRQFSPLSFIQYMGLCVFSLPNSSTLS